MRGSLLESEKQHQDVPILDRQTEIQRKMNNSNDFQSDVHPQHLPGSPHSLGLQHNRQVGIILSARRSRSIKCKPTYCIIFFYKSQLCV